MKTASVILAELYQDKELDGCIERLIPPYNRDDFKQDLFIILIGKGDRIVQLYEAGQLKLFVVGIIVRQSRQVRASYHTTYVEPSKTVDITERMDVADRCEEMPEITPEMLKEVDEEFKIDSEYPYYSRIIEALTRVKSMRQLSQETGIALSSISRAVAKVRSHLKKKLYD